MPRRLVIYGSCQAEVLYFVLKELYPDAFAYQCFPFYRYTNGEPMPEGFTDTDVFVYQPLLNRKRVESRQQYETAPMVASFRGRGVQCVGFPFLHFDGYHPDYAFDPLNESTRSPQKPWGLFPYGMQSVMDLRGSIPVSEIVERTKAEDFLPTESILRPLESSLSLLHENEADCDVKAAEWVEKHYRRELLFHAVNHPTNALLQIVFDGVLERLGLPPVDLSRRPELLGESRPPIYPCVRRTTGLGFDVSPVIGNRETSYDEYMIAYASLSADADYRARLDCSNCPPVMRAGHETDVRVVLSNDGSGAWHAPDQERPGVSVSYHWERDGQIYRWDNTRARLPRTMMPGETVVVEPRVEAPVEPGSYVLSWDLVIEGVTWFSSKGCVFPRQPVRVDP